MIQTDSSRLGGGADARQSPQPSALPKLNDGSALLNQAMLMLAAQPGAIFIGQGVACDGVATFDSLAGVPMEQRIETPVVEELQVGMGIGMSLMGYLPILIYPRCDFLLRAMDQIVNHLDKLDYMSAGQFRPKVIIRARVGKRTPLDAGPQHSQDHTDAFRSMLRHVCVFRIPFACDIMDVYKKVVEYDRPSIVVEAF